jgi:3',5'-cyclic AMP phosphodiesterase CpdA
MGKIRIFFKAFLGVAILINTHALFAQQKSPVIAFTADTQAPLLLERVIHKTNHNEKATEMIFNDITDKAPTALFILGDVVSLSCENNSWAKMDGYLNTCRQKKIPVYATLGNHEVMLNAARGQHNFQSRFPMYSPVGYLEVIDSVAVVLLNSNFGKMADSAIVKQDEWYNQTVKNLDNDPAIKFVIVGCHHSPYTNSKVVPPSVEVQRHFVPAFINSKKCVLFLSGHSHNFEHFNVQGKNFFVIGGGGGLHQPLRTGNDQVTPDLSADYKPMFHYLEVKREADELQITSRQLKADFAGFEDGFNVTLSPN